MVQNDEDFRTSSDTLLVLGKSRDTKQPLELKVHLHWVDFTLGNTQSSIHRWIHITEMRLRFSPKGQVKNQMAVHEALSGQWQHATPFSAVMPCVGLNWGCDVPEHKMAHEHGVLHSAVWKSWLSLTLEFIGSPDCRKQGSQQKHNFTLKCCALFGQ
ncbi:hypothetical protein D5F01_LYC07134 [Larimichthys crocea]|uniref:Uncharacterized protein n=1 Tax=Larimichthys crocea TaxID=215358 RepID=A0A6G0ISH3_LARCR|nr:hypothetical protein D5F01_LYC07134 [Larimichthys crocea]